MKKVLFLFTLVILAGVISVNDIFGQIAESITVTTDKTSYEEGDTIFVTGEVQELLSGYPISLRVLAPNGNLVTLVQLDVNSDKTFSTEITPDELWISSGTYTIVALYGTESRTAETTFTFEGSTGTIPHTGTTVAVQDTDFIVNYKITGGKLIRIDPDVGAHSLIIAITANQDGSLEITLPKSLTDAKMGDQYDTFFVLVDGVEFDFEETTTSTDRTLTIQFPAGSEEIEVIGKDLDTNQTIQSISDDLPLEITIIPASGSSAPSCEETSQGCYIPNVASVAVGGKVIFSNTDTAVHTFTSGIPTGEALGEVFDSSLVMAGSSYEWTPTTVGEVPYFCMVHPWMTGTIFVGEGTYIPPQPEDDFDLQITMGNQVYDLSDTATMNLSIGGISTPQNVALEISDPRGTTVISRSFMVDSEGISFEFRIDENFKTGTYKVVATTSDNGNTITDIAYFKVISQYNSFKITSVQVTDQQGNPSSLQKGEMGFIKVNLDANKSITTLVTVNLFDSDLTSIGIGSIKTTLSSGNSEIILSFMIPSDVAVGSANIYVNAFSDWPSNGGIPLTGEISIMENIE